MSLPGVSVVIPTYRRERVLLESVEWLLALPDPPSELLLIDQTETHEPDTERRLRELDAAGSLRWIRQQHPSIPEAMNRGLVEARHELVLFLDDDIRPEAGLVAGHARAHGDTADLLVAGRVIQPWEEGVEFTPADGFRFAGTTPAWIEEFMGGNFSVRRATALGLGGFDENFVKVAYRFEAEFAYRLRRAGLRIRFEPGATIHHLKAGGGTRTFGDFLTTWKPDHSVGAYYHALQTKGEKGWWRVFFQRPWRAIATRHHLRRPWWIPVTCFAEASGMAWALWLALSGPRYAVAQGRP
jgi:GT2 family glycosyltransferase